MGLWQIQLAAIQWGQLLPLHCVGDPGLVEGVDVTGVPELEVSSTGQAIALCLRLQLSKLRNKLS